MKTIQSKLKALALILTIGLVSMGCSKDDDGGSASNANILIVYLKATTSSGIDIQYNDETFCYDDGECSTSSGSTFITAFGNSKIVMSSSISSKVATGVKISNIEVNSGTGVIEVVRGRAIDGEWDEFEEVETVYTSEVLSTGDVFNLEYGTTE